MSYIGYRERTEPSLGEGYTIALDVGLSKTGRPPFGVYGGTSPSNVAIVPYMGTYYIVVTVNKNYPYEPGITKVQPVAGARVHLIVRHGDKVVLNKVLITNSRGYATTLFTFDMLGEYRVIATYMRHVAEFKVIITYNPSLFKITDYVCKGTDDTCTSTSIEVSPGSLVTVHGSVTYAGKGVSGLKVVIEGGGPSPPEAVVKDGRFKATLLMDKSYEGRKVIFTPILRVDHHEIRGDPVEVYVSPETKAKKPTTTPATKPSKPTTAPSEQPTTPSAPVQKRVPVRYAPVTAPERRVPAFPPERYQPQPQPQPQPKKPEEKREVSVHDIVRIAGIIAASAAGAAIVYTALKRRR